MSNPPSPTLSASRPVTPRADAPRPPPINTRLRPANFGHSTGANPAAVPLPTTPLPHWSLTSLMDTSRYLTLCGRLPHKLTTSNYVSWMVATESQLDTIDLLGYVNREIAPRKPYHLEYPNWQAANALVRSILVTNMSEDIVVQISHIKLASEIWSEARCLFSGQTITDFTLTITSLVTTKYVNGEDIPAHLAKIKGYRHDLTLMGRDIDDGLFACFMRISMPRTWNYVFAGLPNDYTSAEVERRIKDEYGIKTNQESVTMAYRAGRTSGRGKSGDTTCDNCHRAGHLKRDCWSPGGGAEGKGPRQKKKGKSKQTNKRKDDERKKSRDNANQAVSNKSDSDQEEHEAFMAMTSSHSHSHF